MGKVLKGGEGQSSPSHPGSSSIWGVRDSILGVDKWGRCCKVGRDKAAPLPGSSINWGVGDSILGVSKWGRC